MEKDATMEMGATMEKDATTMRNDRRKRYGVLSRLQLYKVLRKNNRLSYKRSPALEQSKVARVLMYIGAAMAAVYMLFFGVMMGMAAMEGGEPATLLVVLPVFLLIDFFVRFAIQQTPSMLVKPYMLLPIPQHSVIENFLVSSVTSGYNLLWLFLFVPYSYIIIVSGLGLKEGLIILLSGMLLIMINSQWYLMVRTLVNRSLLWWLLPAVVYAPYIILLITDNDDAFYSMGYFLGEAASSWLLPLALLAVLAGMLWLSRWMQFRFVYEEIARQEKRPGAMKHVTNFSFLERFGQTGEYLKLEVKSILRNKAIRARVIMSLALIVVLSALIAYTNIYDGVLMLNFWCYYCFAIYGMTTLVKVMGPEGNYIDLLMTQRENILLLLRAKYYFHVVILFVPLVVMMPAIIAGKFSPLMVLSYMLLSSGMLYFIMFQLAVYNKQTLPLDQKLTGKNNVESGFQLVLELSAMFVPLLLVAVLVMLFDENTAYWVLAAVGLAFTLTHQLWLRNIYVRMMRRKYQNLEGFHASR